MPPKTGLALVAEYFGYAKLGEFRADWSELSDESKRQLRDGIENGTFTY